MKKEITIEVNIPEGYEAEWNEEEKKVEFKKINERPKTWEEYCKHNTKENKYYISVSSNIETLLKCKIDDINDKNLINSKEEAEAFIALMQLRLLRKAWVGEWEPDWKVDWKVGYSPECVKWCIRVFQNELNCCGHYCETHPLSFPEKKMAEEFLECFRDLIEQAKILL